jgi:hypothetical protein
MNLRDVEIGFQVFLSEGGEEFGAVRAVGPRELVVYVENGGDFVVPAEAVQSAHDGKVVLDGSRLDARIWAAISHAHDREDPSY